MPSVQRGARDNDSMRWRQRQRWYQYWMDPIGTVEEGVVRLTMNDDTRTTMAGDSRIAYLAVVPAPVPPDHPHAQALRVTADALNGRTTMGGDRRLTNGRRLG